MPGPTLEGFNSIPETIEAFRMLPFLCPEKDAARA